MKKKFFQVCTTVKAKVSNASRRAKLMAMGAVFAALSPAGAFAQELAGTGYDAGTSALEEVASELVKYVPYVVNLCYALAGIVAIVGAISVYIAMNNEEQDVKNVLALGFGRCNKCEEMTLNRLIPSGYSFGSVCRFLP